MCQLQNILGWYTVSAMLFYFLFLDASNGKGVHSSRVGNPRKKLSRSTVRWHYKSLSLHGDPCQPVIHNHRNPWHVIGLRIFPWISYLWKLLRGNLQLENEVFILSVHSVIITLIKNPSTREEERNLFAHIFQVVWCMKLQTSSGHSCQLANHPLVDMPSESKKS